MLLIETEKNSSELFQVTLYKNMLTKEKINE